jgi:hypothetical protein
LAEKAGKDPMWLCENVAIGETEGERRIYVSGDSGGASSLLVSTGHVETHAPELRMVGSER